MENSPFGPNSSESDSKDSKESKDSKSSNKAKRAEAIGAVLFEPKPKEQPEKAKEKPAAEPEVSESKAPLEALSDEERQYVEAAIVSSEYDAAPDQEIEPTEETIAAEAAVERFREKIIEEGQDSEQAFSETIHEINEAPEEPIEQPESEHESEPEVMLEAPEEALIDLRSNEDTPEPIVFGSRTPRSDLPVAPVAEKTVYVERPDPGSFLVGGIIGYLVGRRRGRIKTEKQLIPVQKKLEKQVVGLQQELQRKETVIRQTAVEKMRARKTEAAETKERKRPEKHKAVPLERIGKVVIGAEAVTTRREVEAESDKRVSPLEGLTEKDIVTLDRQELLAVSEKIIVESTSLRHIYETHLIGEKGLRRLVAEFLRGGNLNKALKRELVEKEIDFERDPILRDKNRSGGTEGGGTHLDALLKKVDNLPGGDTGEMAVLKARAAHEAAELTKKEQRRKLADMSLVAVIAVLLAAVITLLLSR